MKSKATIIINSYREKPEYLHKTIDSFLVQEGVDIQVIVSTVLEDPAINISKEYNQVELCVSKKPNIYQQLNNALSYVKGEWVSYMSSNDVPVSDKFKQEIEACIKNNKKICYSDIYICDENLNINGIRTFHQYNHKKHLQGNFVTDGATWHRSLLKYTPFELKWGNHAFWDFWLRIYEAEGDIFIYNNNPTFLYRHTDQSLHIQRKRDSYKKIINNNLKIKMLKSHE